MWEDLQIVSRTPEGKNLPHGGLETGGDAPLFAYLPGSFPLEKIKPKITFYMKRDGQVEEILSLDDTSGVADVNNDYSFTRDLDRCKNRVILITHGFHSGGDVSWLIEMRNALLDVETQIVAIVDWKGGAHVTSYEAVDIFKDPTLYKQAAANCLVIGQWVAQVGTWLKLRMDGSGGGYLWGIGHSLGAHLMGMAGHVGNKARLDPAGPGFQTNLLGYRRLCPKDAKMVDVIHTDARHYESPVKIPYFGTILPLGTIDFYPNFGFGTRTSILGNHALAHELFTWSIKNPGKLETIQKLKENGTITILNPIGVVVNACKELSEDVTGAELGYFTNKGFFQDGNWHVSINPEQPFAPFFDIPSQIKTKPPLELILTGSQGCWGTEPVNLPRRVDSVQNVVETTKVIADKLTSFVNLFKGLGRGGGPFGGSGWF